MVTESKRKANDKWDDANLEQLNISLPKGTKKRWKEQAERMGLSLTKFLQEAADRMAEKDVSKKC